MARGWESKSIEAQQDEAARKKTVKPPMTADQRSKLERRRSLELALARATDDLSRASSPHHRRMLEQARHALEQQLAELQ